LTTGSFPHGNFSSVYWIFTKLGHMIPFHVGIMWPSLVKIQYTELKLSCGNDPVVRNSIYSNGDLDLWPNDPKINRVLPLPQGNHVTKIQYTELKLCGNDPVVRNYIYSNGDLDLWPNDPKINRVLPLPQGNHVAKFGKDPIYRTKVIVWKPVWTTAARHTQSHNKACLETKAC
jgi:hypothetical protein